MALKAGRVGVAPDQVDPYGKISGGGGGGYVLPTASADTLGGVKVGNGLTMTDGVLSSDNPTPYTLPTASADTLGGVKVGSGLTVEDGVLSASGGSSPHLYMHIITTNQYGCKWLTFFSADSTPITTAVALRTAMTNAGYTHSNSAYATGVGRSSASPDTVYNHYAVYNDYTQAFIYDAQDNTMKSAGIIDGGTISDTVITIF